MMFSDKIVNFDIMQALNILNAASTSQLREIEKVLLMHPAVGDAAVIGVADDIWGEKVAAVIIPKSHTHCTQESLINLCRQHLAGYKCPRVIFFAETLPRNAAQKIMKNKLQMIYNATVHI